jgi:hypothetical protein
MPWYVYVYDDDDDDDTYCLLSDKNCSYLHQMITCFSLIAIIRP